MIVRLLFGKKPPVQQIKQLTLPPVDDPVDQFEANGHEAVSWQEQYWGIMKREELAELPDDMQRALLTWWDSIVPREDDGV